MRVTVDPDQVKKRLSGIERFIRVPRKPGSRRGRSATGGNASGHVVAAGDSEEPSEPPEKASTPAGFWSGLCKEKVILKASLLNECQFCI